MGWIILDKPGTETGPCEGECTHVDCAQTRANVAEICPFCNEPIGYGVPFYAENGMTDLRHAFCQQRRMETPQLRDPIAICWHCREVLGPDRVCSTHGQLR